MDDAQTAERAALLHMLEAGASLAALARGTAWLEQVPEDGELLVHMARAFKARGDSAAAESHARRALAPGQDASVAVPALVGLLDLLCETGRRGEAEAVLATHAPLVADAASGAMEREPARQLMQGLWTAGFLDEAAAIGRGLLPGAPELTETVARILLEAGFVDEADDLLAASPALSGETVVLVRAAIRAAKSLDVRRPVEAYVEAAPAYLSPQRPGQSLTVALVNPMPDLPPGLFGLDLLHLQANFAAQLATRRADRLRALSVIAPARGALDSIRGLPRPDVTLNNVVNAEVLRTPGAAQQVAALAQALGAPVVNGPERAVHATRQENAQVLSRVPGVIAPRVGRFWNDQNRREDLVRRLSELFGYPMIVRTVFEQMGSGTWRVDSPEALRELLPRIKAEPQIYAIEYRAHPNPEGIHRVLRAAFVGGKPRIIRADFGLSWNVRARRELVTQSFYRDRPEFLEQGNAIVQDPEAHLPASALKTLASLGTILPLEIFGMDFDVSPAGGVVVFEANATMNLFTNVSPDLAYPAEPERALADDIIGYLESRAAR
jgi:hypothetical protein